MSNKILLTLSLLSSVTFYCAAQPMMYLDTVGHGMGGKTPYVKAMAVNDTNEGIIYAGGDFTTTEGRISNHIAQWYGNYTSYDQSGTWYNLGHGVNGEVTAIAVYKHQIIAGGAFDSASGVEAHYIARWDSIHGWDSIPGRLNGQVYALLVYDTVLYVAGSFTKVNGITVNRIAKWDGKAWFAVGAGFDSNTVYSLVGYVRNTYDTLYAGGSFTKSNGVTVNYVAKWNGTKWLPIGGGMNNAVYSLTSFKDSLFAGGAFTMAGGITVGYVAESDGVTWKSTGPAMNDTVKSLINAGHQYGEIFKSTEGNHDNTGLIAGGSFTRAGNTNAGYLSIYWNLWPSPIGWYGLPSLNGPVNVVTSNDYNNYVGGTFDSITSNFFSNPMLTNYVAQFYYILGGGINELSNNNNIKVYPNPSNGIFNYELQMANYESVCVINIYNMLGENVLSTQPVIRNSSFVINLSNQPTGIYFYRILSEKGELIGNGKLIKE